MAEASLAQAQATVTETRAKAARSRELAARNIASQQTLETDEAAAQRAVAAVASATAQVTVSTATLRESETALRKAVIRAPIDGVIISREIRPGQTVAASFQTPVLFKLAGDLRHMELHFDLDESDVGQVREGQHAEFRVDAYPGRAFDAKIVSVRFNPREVNNVVTYETVLSVENPDLSLRPGNDRDGRDPDRRERHGVARAESCAAIPAAGGRAGSRHRRRRTRRRSGWFATAPPWPFRFEPD